MIYATTIAFSFAVSVSTFLVAYKNATNYTLIHSAIASIFVPVVILAFLSAHNYRYEPRKYHKDYHYMIRDYRISSVLYHSEWLKLHVAGTVGRRHKSTGDIFSLLLKQSNENTNDNNNNDQEDEEERLHTFTNNIDIIQSRYSCCGVESHVDWTQVWSGYIAPTCCSNPSKAQNEEWSRKFHIPKKFEFEYCKPEVVYGNCVEALEKSENSKYSYLVCFSVILIVLLVTDAICSFLLFGTSKTANRERENFEEFQLSLKPRPSIPAITSIKPRPSLGNALFGNQTVSVLDKGIVVNDVDKSKRPSQPQSVRFNFVDDMQYHRPSISGPPKFSEGARRQSNFSIVQTRD